jgi:hypothetical protein
MNTETFSILRPLTAQVGLTLIVWFYMMALRLGYMHKKRIHPERLRLAGAEADDLLKEVDGPSDNFVNLLEVPVLFYVAVGTIIVGGWNDSTYVMLAWVFVGLRAVHSLIHCTYNRVTHRFFAYALSTLVLLVIWIRIAITLGS